MIVASWGKQIASGFKLVIQCFPSIVLASVITFDAAADTNTDIDGNADTDAVIFNAEIDSHFIPDDNDTYDLGSASKKWRLG